MAAKTPVTSALSVPALDDDAITAALRSNGAIAEAPEPSVLRIKVDGSSFVVGDDIFTYNPANKQPAFRARIAAPLRQYQALWFNEEMAAIAGRPEIANRFNKSYFDIPTQNRVRAEDGTDCNTCPFGPWTKNRPILADGREADKCKWKGDLALQIIPDSGQLDGDEPVWLLTMSTTGVIEFVGTPKSQPRGSVSDHNFMHKLARLGAAESPDDQQAGVNRALISYMNGGVVVEARLLTQTSDDRSMTWKVPSFEPIHIIDVDPVTEAPALAEGEPRNVTPDGADYSDLPF